MILESITSKREENPLYVCDTVVMDERGDLLYFARIGSFQWRLL